MIFFFSEKVSHLSFEGIRESFIFRRRDWDLGEREKDDFSLRRWRLKGGAPGEEEESKRERELTGCLGS